MVLVVSLMLHASPLCYCLSVTSTLFQRAENHLQWSELSDSISFSLALMYADSQSVRMNPIKSKGEAQQSRTLFPVTAAGQEIRGWGVGRGALERKCLYDEEEASHSSHAAMQH